MKSSKVNVMEWDISEFNVLDWVISEFNVRLNRFQLN